MNTVSWLIYTISLLNGLTGALSSLILAALVMLGAALIRYFWNHDGMYNTDEDRKSSKEFLSKWSTRCLATILVSMFLLVLIPSEKAMYMIAASELGEEVVKTPEAKQLYQDLRDVLNSYKQEESK